MNKIDEIISEIFKIMKKYNVVVVINHGYKCMTKEIINAYPYITIFNYQFSIFYDISLMLQS